MFPMPATAIIINENAAAAAAGSAADDDDDDNDDDVKEEKGKGWGAEAWRKGLGGMSGLSTAEQQQTIRSRRKTLCPLPSSTATIVELFSVFALSYQYLLSQQQQ